jgi:RNA 3'-terminal phosphate cyclase-like protein
VYVYTDHLKGVASGLSPGFGIQLIASSTSGCLYGSQRCSGVARGTAEALADAATGAGAAPVPLPEDLGRAAAAQLLDEIARGGCVDTIVQPLVFTLMALCPEDVSRVRVGQIGPNGVETLRLLRDFFSVTFKLKPEAQAAVPSQALPAAGEKRDRDEPGAAGGAGLVPRALMTSKQSAGGHSGNTVLVSCLGTGFRNVSKKVT